MCIRDSYYHTDFVHSWYKKLDPEMTGLDYPVPARAKVPDSPENAYWDGYGTNYGAGGEFTRNFALFSNVIYHEYTHGVTSWMYRDIEMPYYNEPGALNEAFSDYIACSISDFPYAGWRVHTDDSYIRNLENDLVYPDDWYGEVHYDSRMISAAFWEIRQGVYPDRVGWADTLVHFTRYSGAKHFNDFAVECFFTADDDGDISNGCPNLALIANSFDRHGIGPGHYPTLTAELDSIIDLGDGDGYLEPTEQFQLLVNISYYNDFPYPTVEDIYVLTEFMDEQIESVSPAYELGDLPNGYSRTAILTYRVADSALPHYSTVSIGAGTPEIPMEIISSIEILIGSPQVLLVNGSGVENYTHYYRNALKQIPIVYEQISATESAPTASYMNRFPIVIWFTGDAENSISSQNMDAISEYLDSGGNFVLTGQDGFDDDEYNEFLDNYFGASVDIDSIMTGLVDGIEEDTLGSGFNLMIAGASGANNQHSSSTLSPTSGTPFLQYRFEDEPFAGIRYETTNFNTILLGFGMEAIGFEGGGHINLQSALTRIIQWFGTQIYSQVQNEITSASRWIYIFRTGGSIQFQNTYAE